MRAEFIRGLDPKDAMGIGLMKRFRETVKALQDEYVLNFDENELTYIITVSNNYDAEPEDFHNPSGHPAYDWEANSITAYFNIIHEATIDLKSNKIVMSFAVSNPDIQNFNWTDYSTREISSSDSPERIAEIVEEEFMLYDVYEAASAAWDRVQENQQEKEDEIDDHMNENEEYDTSDTGWVDVDDNIDGSVTISYKHQTSADDHEVDETRAIDPFFMDMHLALKLGLSLKAVHDEDVTIIIKNISKLKNDKWLFVTNYGELTLTLSDLEKLADKR